jgi:hypothetical protein
MTTVIDRAAVTLPSANGYLPPSDEATFAAPIPASELKLGDPDADWLWHGFVARHSITLLSSLWKTGKTTLLAHLLKSFEGGGLFCGRTVRPAKVLYITEEPESLWAHRRDNLGIADHVHFQIRPFKRRPSDLSWLALIQHAQKYVEAHPFDLVFLDPLTTLWPVEKENEAGIVSGALMPLRTISEKAAVVLIHHFRKSGGDEATGSRGSGALTGFVDTIIELRRYNPGDRKDKRRVLSAYGRYEETPDETVFELTETGYIARGDRHDMQCGETAVLIAPLLPPNAPGWTTEDVKKAVDKDLGDDGPGPAKGKLLEALNDGADAGRWNRAGEGVKGDPFRFWAKPLPD